MPCPAPQKGFVPRELFSPSALRADKDCRAMWGRAMLEGRREEEVDYFALPPPPPKCAKGASAADKVRRKHAIKAYNKQMRPALGKATHAVLEAYYKQKVKGEAPGLDLDVAWHTRPGQVALSGRQHLPAPEDCADVWCEELVLLEPPEGWAALDLGAFPPMGGTADLVVLLASRRFKLIDHKTTVDFEYAKTAEELLEDEQANMYGLAVMQRHGLAELECTWVYYRTDADKPPASMAVHFTLSRAHAEAHVVELAKQASELNAIQQAYLAERPGLLGKRLAILQALPTNDSACDNYGGCQYHHSQVGGICKPKKSTLGAALRKQAEASKKTQRRREAAKKAKEEATTMNATDTARLATLTAQPKRNFKENQELLKLQKAAKAEAHSDAEETPAGEAPEEIEASGEEAPAEEAQEKPAKAEPKAAAKPKPGAVVDATDLVEARALGITIEIAKSSPLYKAILKVVKARAAYDAAMAGEL